MAVSCPNLTEAMHYRCRPLHSNARSEQLMMNNICNCVIACDQFVAREINCPECNHPRHRINSNPESPELYTANPNLQIVPSRQLHEDQVHMDVNLRDIETDSEDNSEDETFEESGDERRYGFGPNNIIWVLNNLLDEDEKKEEVEEIDR